MSEFETVAWIKTDSYSRQIPVTVSYEQNFYKPLELCVEDEHGNEITEQLEPDEYELLYEKATRHAVEMYTDHADFMEDR